MHFEKRPNYAADCWPQYCQEPDWTPVSGQLEQEMLQYWNWCKDSIDDQQSSWEHEWYRHGMNAYDPTNSNLVLSSSKWFISLIVGVYRNLHQILQFINITE